MGAYLTNTTVPFISMTGCIVAITLIIQVNVPGSCCFTFEGSVPGLGGDLWFRKSPGHTGLWNHSVDLIPTDIAENTSFSPSPLG